MQRCVALKGIINARFTALRGLAILVADRCQLFIVDVRTGRTLRQHHEQRAICDCTVDDSGQHLVLRVAGCEGSEYDVIDLAISDLLSGRASNASETKPGVGDAMAQEHPRPDTIVDPLAVSVADTRSLTAETSTPRMASPDELTLRKGATDLSAPDVAFRQFEPDIAATTDTGRLTATATTLLEQAICHATMLIERLLFVTRNLGLVPWSGHDDPANWVSDGDITTILAGFRKIRSTHPTERRNLITDPFVEQIGNSRRVLRDVLALDGAHEVGFARIVRAFALSDTALDLLVLTFAAEWDLRLGRVYGFLNHDPRQQRPKLAHLLMTAQQGLPSVDTDAFALIRNDLIECGLLEIDRAGADVALNNRSVRPVEYLVDLSSAASVRSRLDAKSWDELQWNESERAQMRSALRRELHRAGPRRLIVLEGPPGSGRLAMACAAALDVGTGFELCQTTMSDKEEVSQMERQLGRAAYRAKLTGGVLIVRGDHVLSRWPKFMSILQDLSSLLDIGVFVTVRSGELAEASENVRFVRFEPPRLGPTERRLLWQERLRSSQLYASEATIDDITARYAITPGRLVELVDELRMRQGWRQTAIVEVGDVRETLREVTVQKMGDIAKRYRSSIRLSDLILPQNVLDRLTELVHRLRHRQRVLGGWAFADKAHESYGVSTLFCGPPGTGKTAAAVAVANDLEIDLYVVDFSGIMSKWVGETERNLARVFDEAEASSVALLFDEADALFGKRSSEQGSSSDRYANLTINYLLQRMESYSGLAILTTNLESAMDEAFQRRITNRVKFPPADDVQREELWRHLLPKGASYGADVDITQLSQMLRMEGAHIQRALTRAAFRAAARGQTRPVLTHADLLWAANAEYEDLGRLTLGSDRFSTS